MLENAKFTLGRVVASPGASAAIADAAETWASLIKRHITGDWSEMDPADAKENEFSVQNGFRIQSTYTLSTGVRLWIITEGDRSVTTLLLPGEC